jgi:hypothetical protein
MIRITKGDIVLECETQADMRLALGVLADVDVPALPSMHIPVEVNAPDWEPIPLPPVGSGILAHYVDKDYGMVTEPGEPGKPKLVAVPTVSPEQQAARYVQEHAPQCVPVRAKQLDILEVVLLFPEGVPVKGIAQLLGLTDKTVGQRIQALKADSLVEHVPHHHLWRATTLARRAKLVRC